MNYQLIIIDYQLIIISYQLIIIIVPIVLYPSPYLFCRSMKFVSNVLGLNLMQVFLAIA